MICVSGGFDPLHVGHLSMFARAAEMGPLTVILNSDEWLVRKKGFFFQSWEDRAALIRSLRAVDAVEPVDDADGTVCEALRRLRPAVFLNSGDRQIGNTPEAGLCREMNIATVFVASEFPGVHSSRIAARVRPFISPNESRL